MTEFSIEPRVALAGTKWLVEIWSPLPGVAAVFMSGINPASFTFILLSCVDDSFPGGADVILRVA